MPESPVRLLSKHRATTKAFVIHHIRAPLSHRLSKRKAPATCGRSTYCYAASRPSIWLQSSHRIVPPAELPVTLGNKGIKMEDHFLRPAHGIANALAMSVPFWAVVAEVVWTLT